MNTLCRICASCGVTAAAARVQKVGRFETLAKQLEAQLAALPGGSAANLNPATAPPHTTTLCTCR